MLLPQSYSYPKLSEGTDSVGGQPHGDKECPFRGVTSSGRVWEKELKSDAWSVSIISLAETKISDEEPHLCRTEKDPWLMR